MSNHPSTREIIVRSAQNSNNVKIVTDNIFQLFESNTKAWWFSEEDYLNAGKEVPQENKDLSVMDLYYWKEIKDDDLSFLSWFLWWWEYVRQNVDWEPYITDEWLKQLNYILDMASKHARRHGLWATYFRKVFWEDWLDLMSFEWEEKLVKRPNWWEEMAELKGSWKVFFHINNKEEYLKLLKFLTSENEDNFLLTEENWFFLKHIVAMWYLSRNDAYTKRRRLFHYSTTDIFWKFFNHEFRPPQVDINAHWDHGNNITETFMWNINWKPTEITLRWNIKSERSTMDKIMREKKANATNDIIRFQLTFTNHEELVRWLYDFLEFYMKDSWHVFDHENGDFGNLKWFDKWGLRSQNDFFEKHIKDLPDWQVKTFIESIKNNRKEWSSTDYRDVKVIVPVVLKWIPFNMEIKFVTKDYEAFNDRWYSSHAILKWAEKIEFICRHKKFITENWIKRIVNEVIQESPELIDQIANWDEEALHEELFKYFVNKCEKLNIPGQKTAYIFKDIQDTLNKYSFIPDFPEEQDDKKSSDTNCW